MRQIDDFVRDDAALSWRQLIVIRVVWGLVALQTAGTLSQQFAIARSGDFFNLPLLDAWPLVPDLLHRLLLHGSFLFALLLLTGAAPRVGAFGMSAVLAYVLISDYFAFRHVWVLLANIFFWVGMLSSKQKTDIGPTGSSPSSRQYSLFAIRGFVALAYLIASFPKLNRDFLTGDVIRLLALEQWGSDSIAAALFESSTLVGPLLALSSCLIEVYLAVALTIPRLRPSAFVVGMLFHTLVPLVAWVGHSLNLYFVACYLFFAWPPGNRPQRAGDSGHRLTRIARRLDPLRRIEWGKDRSARPIRLSDVLQQTLYGNPIFLWYGAAWFLLICAKSLQSLWFLPAWLAAALILIVEFRRLWRSSEATA